MIKNTFQKVYRRIISQHNLNKAEPTYNQLKSKEIKSKYFYDSIDPQLTIENLKKYINFENIKLWKKFLELQDFQRQNTQFILFSNVNITPNLLDYLNKSNGILFNNLSAIKIGNGYIAINQDGDQLFMLELFQYMYNKNLFNYSLIEDEFLTPLLNAQWKVISRQEYQAL